MKRLAQKILILSVIFKQKNITTNNFLLTLVSLFGNTCSLSKNILKNTKIYTRRQAIRRAAVVVRPNPPKSAPPPAVVVHPRLARPAKPAPRAVGNLY